MRGGYGFTVGDFNAHYRILMEQRGTAAVVALALLVAALAFMKTWKSWRAHLRGKPILTANEREFFHRLQRALPQFHIFPQVSFSAIMTLERTLSEKRRFALRRRFAWKYADFVVCERGTLSILAVIELDDRMHNAADDRKRDAVVAAVGYRTLRFRSNQKPSEAQIAALFSLDTPTPYRRARL